MEGIYNCTAAAGDHSSATLVLTGADPAEVTIELTSPTHSLSVQEGKNYRLSFETAY